MGPTLVSWSCKKYNTWAVIVVAQLVEQSLRTPEACSSNRVIGKIYIEHLLKVNCIEKTKIKKTEAGAHSWHFLFSRCGYIEITGGWI